MKYARLRLAAAFALASVAGCANVDPSEIAASEEALTVCHTTVVEGIDVASFQGTIDWNMVHASGREFAIARIGDGTYSDPTFHTNYNGIHAAGMIRGAYLFWRPSVGADTQAAAIASAVGTVGAGDLPVTIDVECMCPFVSGGGCAVGGAGCVSTATADANLRSLVSQVAASTGRMPMIYTGTWFWDGSTYLNDTITIPSAPLWVSGYNRTNCVAVPQGWTEWQFWQYSDGTCSTCDTSHIAGISGSGVDRDRWNGDLASLQAFTGGGHPIYGGHYVMQSFPLSADGPLQIPQGGSVAAYIEMRNSGTAPWDGNTRLGTTVARDRTDMFVAPDWINDHRLAGVPAGMTIAPGANYRFQWTFHVPPGTPPGMYDEHFGLVEEGVVWFGDAGQGGPTDSTIEVIIEVTQGPDAGTPPVDAAVVLRDSGNTATGDASHVTSDAATSTEDSGVVMGRAISGGCGCHAGTRSSSGACLLPLLAIVIARRKRRPRA